MTLTKISSKVKIVKTKVEEAVPTRPDLEPPAIQLPDELVSDAPELNLVGKISDQSDIESLIIDGKTVAVGADGSFSHSIYVPRRGVEIHVAAVDSHGNRAEKLINISRSVAKEETSYSFEKLDPMAIRGIENSNAIAVVIGIDDYSIAPDAFFADLDAEYFADYANLVLGVPTKNMKVLINFKASIVNMRRVMKRWLPAMIRQGKTDVYLFFAGHGLASMNGKKLYLLPEDGLPGLVEDTAILQGEIYDVLAAANPRTVTIFLDASFSGWSRGNEALISNPHSITHSFKHGLSPDRFTVFTASALDEISGGLPEAKHGLFSYFLMKGMEGEADANADRRITVGELHDYVSGNVSRQALRLGRVQTPQLRGDAGRVLVAW
jgi:hypothetical protein